MTMSVQDATRSDTEGRRHSLVDEAYVQLKERIINNILPPGYQALEQEVAKQLGMSRTPVREALIRLEEDGLVEVMPRRGVRILPLSVDDIREIGDLLTALEATAAGLAARRKLGADDPELVSLESAIADMDVALRDDELEAWAQAEDAFRLTLLEASKNSRLIKAARLLVNAWKRSPRS